MSNTVFIPKTSFQQLSFNTEKLLNELILINFSSPVMTVLDIEENAIIVFENDTEPSDLTALNSAINNHLAVTQQEQVEYIVKSAIDFGQKLIIEFASENILMGITQAGKTKEVADYLANIMRYAQSGSLYEIMNEVDYLISNTVPSSLSPFVTESRLLLFKQKVQDYLT